MVSAESPETGTLTIQWQGHDTPVQAEHVRRAILCAHAVAFVATESDPVRILLEFVYSVDSGSEHPAWASTSLGWQLTKISQRYPNVTAAMFQVAACGLHLNGVVAARVGRKTPTLPGLHDFELNATAESGNCLSSQAFHDST